MIDDISLFQDTKNILIFSKVNDETIEGKFTLDFFVLFCTIKSKGNDEFAFDLIKRTVKNDRRRKNC